MRAYSPNNNVTLRRPDMCNWGLESQTNDRGQVVGEVQPGTVVNEDD